MPGFRHALLLPLLLLLCGAAPQDNRAVIKDFADIFYRQRDVRRAFETYVAVTYIQHNPGIADGREAAIRALAPMFGDGQHSFEIRELLVDGDLAVIHVHARPMPDAPGASVFDMYRLQGGKIVEHWDAIQPVPAASANAHPMF